MTFLRRPWGLTVKPDADGSVRFFPADCLMAEGTRETWGRNGTAVFSWTDGQGRAQGRYLLRYPRDPSQFEGAVLDGIPQRWPDRTDPETDQEKDAAAALARMKSLLARVQDLGDALDDPARTWDRLDAAWRAAENEETPRLSEIVRQSRKGDMPRHLSNLEPRIRRVLRRIDELTPLSRVEEIDRKGMIWLSRQPGHSLAERAGSDQRVMAITRHENFDTLENQVLHSYVSVAQHSAKAWLREHAASKSSARYELVEGFRKRCHRLEAKLRELGVRKAVPSVTPNYVLAQDLDYRAVYEAWKLLIDEERIYDDYWGWHAQSWVDFCALASVLGLLRISGSRLVAQSPILWMDEAKRGRWFAQDNPLAVIWLKDQKLVIDVQTRPRTPTRAQAICGAPIWLRVSPVNGGQATRVPIWPVHGFKLIDIQNDATSASRALSMARSASDIDRFGRGLIMSQAFGSPGHIDRITGSAQVDVVLIDAEGPGLRDGMAGLSKFLSALTAELES